MKKQAALGNEKAQIEQAYRDDEAIERISRQAKQSHTPGPWRLIDDDPEDHVTITDIYQDVGVCRLERVSNNSTTEMIANAHLIAAAPCLLEALKVAQAELEQHEPPDEYPTIQASYAEIMELIKVAIEKAGGQ